MTMPTNMRQHAQELITQIPGSSLPQVVAILEELCRSADPTPQTLPYQPQEQALLHNIQQKLTPEEQTRLAYLRQQNEREIITEPEHQELLTYIDRIEQQDAERAEALIQLAQIRKVEQIDTNGQIAIPPHIREQLGLFPGTDIQLEIIGDTLQIRKPTPNRGTLIIAAMRGKVTSKLSTDDIMQLTRNPS